MWIGYQMYLKYHLKRKLKLLQLPLQSTVRMWGKKRCKCTVSGRSVYYTYLDERSMQRVNCSLCLLCTVAVLNRTRHNCYYSSLLPVIQTYFIIQQLSYWTDNLHIYVYPFWCQQKHWPERWSSADPVAGKRHSCWTLSQRRNAAQDAGNSMSDHPERDTLTGKTAAFTHIYCL